MPFLSQARAPARAGDHRLVKRISLLERPLAPAERLDLEGIVAKGKADPYRLGTVWYKIKSQTYGQDEGKWELF